MASWSKRFAQSMLKRTGWYYRAKASRLYDAYWALANPALLRARDTEVQFYRTLLQGFRMGDVIFDVGANGGDKTDVFLRLGAKVVAVEPDSASRDVLWQRFKKLRVTEKDVSIVSKALSHQAGVQTMYVAARGSALIENPVNA